MSPFSVVIGQVEIVLGGSNECYPRSAVWLPGIVERGSQSEVLYCMHRP